ncbi:MAG: methionyl-tRNA formyltransferase [Epsilonproteobacteria bacterium]|nr:methionyl-tRNA formyltransferase [Campylobacterota bacterium]
MKILFIGSVKFSFKALEKLIGLDADIVGVCTKEKSEFNSDFNNLTPLCETNNIPCKIVTDINSKESLEWIKERQPDIIFCFGWSFLLKKELLSIPPLGIVGYHPAKLPQNKGRHPLIWALALGLQKSASTFFFMNEGADEGDILSQKEFAIDYEDDAASLYKKVTNLALKQIEKFLPQLQNKTYTPQKQDGTLANIWRKRSYPDGEIDFRMCSYAIYNLIRSITKPYIGAHLWYNKQEIKVWKVCEVNCDLPNIEPGKVLAVDNNTILVKCYDKAIKILEHDFTTLPQVGEYL